MALVRVDAVEKGHEKTGEPRFGWRLIVEGG